MTKRLGGHFVISEYDTSVWCTLTSQLHHNDASYAADSG